MNEFELIKQFFADAAGASRADVLTGIGDDAARVLSQQPVVTVNLTLQQHLDFQLEDDAASIGHLLLARAVTQLIAKGAQPAWALLSLSMPQADSSWLQAFSMGLQKVATQAGIQLIGGDTTRSTAIRLALNCHGTLPNNNDPEAYRPQVGDLVYVVGDLGESGLAILALQEEIRLPVSVKKAALASLRYPEPALGLEQALSASSVFAFPVTAGLSTALSQALNDHDCGASLYTDQLPCPESVKSRLQLLGGRSMLLSSPQPCTLAMIVPSSQQGLFEQAVTDSGYIATWVGAIESQPGVRVID